MASNTYTIDTSPKSPPEAVTGYREHGVFQMVKRNPHNLVKVESRLDDQPVPQAFVDSSFTTWDACIKALDDYAKKQSASPVGGEPKARGADNGAV